MPASPPRTLLLDNGSLAPAATLELRHLAATLAARIDAPVEPVSLLHSSTLPPEALGGVAAETLETCLARPDAAAGDWTIVPLFFGPSRALTEFLPARVAAARARAPGLRVRLAPPLFATGDERLAAILAEEVRAVWSAEPTEGGARAVALVDHGSPARTVVAVRDALAAQVQRRLGPAGRVAACSMERRPGAAGDRCEPLLATLLRRPGWDHGLVTVAMQFLLPGRHAGPDGDVAAICRAAEAARPGLRTRRTRLVAAHPGLVEILADRWRAGVAAAPL